jgi:hypothetical protein
MRNFVRIDFENKLAYIRCRESESQEDLLVKIDLEDLKLADASTNASWYITKTDKGNNCDHGYVMTSTAQGVVNLHRLICRTPRGLETHHKDDDTLNNTRANLKALTAKEHRLIAKQSDKPRKNSKTGFRGVIKERDGRYRAYYANETLGHFYEPKDAAECAKQYREWVVSMRRLNMAA